MKSVVIYYSYSGNTKKVAGLLTQALAQRGEVEQIELVGLDESRSFLNQARRALFLKHAEIQPVNFNLINYDLICFGSPVWAFAPSPAMNTYLSRCMGLEGKSVVLFATYGSGAGLNRCLDHMQKVLIKKAAKEFRRFAIQQFKVNDKEFVLSKIKEMMRL